MLSPVSAPSTVKVFYTVKTLYTPRKEPPVTDCYRVCAVRGLEANAVPLADMDLFCDHLPSPFAFSADYRGPGALSPTRHGMNASPKRVPKRSGMYRYRVQQHGCKS